MESYIVGWICGVVILVAILIAIVIVVAITVANGSKVSQGTQKWIINGNFGINFDQIIDSNHFFFGITTNNDLWFRDKINYPTNYYLVTINNPFQFQEIQFTGIDLVALDIEFRIWSRNVVDQTRNNLLFPTSIWSGSYADISNIKPWQITEWKPIQLDSLKLLFYKPFGSKEWKLKQNISFSQLQNIQKIFTQYKTVKYNKK